jgi:glycerol uptake facilitator-like aquaporin
VPAFIAAQLAGALAAHLVAATLFTDAPKEVA